MVYMRVTGIVEKGAESPTIRLLSYRDVKDTPLKSSRCHESLYMPIIPGYGYQGNLYKGLLEEFLK